MVREDEIKEKLKLARAEVNRQKANLGLFRAINKGKFDWKPIQEYLTEGDRERVAAKTKDWLTEVHVQSVLSECATYRYNCEKVKPVELMRKDHLSELHAQQAESGIPSLPKKGRGRPPGTEDWCAKELVNNLAVIWLDAKGKLPRREQSQFGGFVREIGEALHEGTWAGIARDVLRERDQVRSRSYLPERPPPAVEESVAREIICAVLARKVEKMRIEEEIRKLPGAERIRKIIWDDDTER